MRKSRFTEAQIIGMIKEQEAGMPTGEVCRKHGLSQGTFYKFKSKYGGMEVSDAVSPDNRAFSSQISGDLTAAEERIFCEDPINLFYHRQRVRVDVISPT